jgi:competence protein ComEC
VTSVLPEIPARWCIAVATSTWVGVSIGLGSRLGLALGIVGFIAMTVRIPKWSWVLLGFCLLGLGSGLMAQSRVDAVSAVELPDGRVDLILRIVEEESGSSWGLSVAQIQSVDGQPWDGPRIAVRDLPEQIDIGSLVTATGTLSKGARWVRGEVVAGTLSIDSVSEALVSRNPIVVSGNAIRRAVARRYDGSSRADGLLSGFLIGDTDRMLVKDQENLRLAGLSHFVAVSGSNVALFLAVWWFVSAPLSMHPQARVFVGGVGLWLFAVITRWESSVVRASAMAAVPLVGGWIGIPVDPWMAVGTAVAFLLLVSGHLITEVGFQLSVLATAGVLVGLAVGKGRRPRWVFIPLFTTIGAQAAVAPLLLGVFGSVPLLAPLTNLVVAPLIAVSTFLAAAGVVVAPVASLGRVTASIVLWVADIASGGPQLGLTGVAICAVVGSMVWLRHTRPVGLALGLVAVALVFPSGSGWPSVPMVTVLDVGQGDSILIQDPSGRSLLFDGGSDPRVLDTALRRHGIRSVDTVVVSHGDADHMAGLVELVGDHRASRVMVSFFNPDLDIVGAAVGAGVPVTTVRAGDRITVGSIDIDVLSPGRRFASDNDGSVVLFVRTPLSVLLPGDLEAVGQRELPDLAPDVMVVPHHGSATTDPRWLAATLGLKAILSYGPNRYGHPHPMIVSLLEDSGIEISRTATDGDIAIDVSH